MDGESSLDQFLNAHKLPLAMGIVGLVLLIGGIVSSGVVSKTFVKSSKSVSTSQSSTIPLAGGYPTEVKVDVSGSVINPGVYTLASSSRVEDAIKAAGGVTETADPVYVTKTLNLAQKVSDGMKIFIPPNYSQGSSSGQASVGQTSAGEVAGASTETQLININTASLADLDKLFSVGPATAKKIIDSRPYGGIEELLTKKAVTRATYDKIKGLVTTW